MNIDRYLQRIDVTKPAAPSLEFLTRLMQRHLMSVPFENLDIGRNVRISLDEAHLYRKIVLSGRGGFCFELNGLFSRLLKALGFSVTLASARVFGRGKNRYGQEFDHLILLVGLDRRYLVDVGFGESFRKPMPMPDGLQKYSHGIYRLRPLSAKGTYRIEKEESGKWRPQFRFTETPRCLGDFLQMCDYHQTSPESHFTRKTICSIATQVGRITLTDTELIMTTGNEKTISSVASQKTFNRLLEKHFKIRLAV